MKKFLGTLVSMISFSFMAQNQYQNIRIDFNSVGKYAPKTEDIFQLDFQKASARRKVYWLGKVNPEEAAAKMVEIFKNDKIEFCPFPPAAELPKNLKSYHKDLNFCKIEYTSL